MKRQRYRKLEGYHARIDDAGKPVKTIVTIPPNDSHQQLIVKDCSNIIVRGACVDNWQSAGDVMKGKPYGIDVAGGCKGLIFESPEVKGSPDSDSKKTWRTSANNGIIVREDNSDIKFINPSVSSVHFGVDIRADMGSIQGGCISVVSADNLCGRGNGWLVDGVAMHTSLEIVDYDELHRDLIQLYHKVPRDGTAAFISDWIIRNCKLGIAPSGIQFEKPAQIFLLSDGVGKSIRFIDNEIITGHDLVAVMSTSIGAEIRRNKIYTYGSCKPQIRVIEERYGVKSEAVVISDNPITILGEECIAEEPKDDLSSFMEEIEANPEMKVAVEELTSEVGGRIKPPRVINTSDLGEDVIQIKTDTEQPSEMSPVGITALEASEGSRRHVYLCTASCETIGVGHALTQDEEKSGKIELESGRLLDYRDDGLSKDEILALLDSDLSRFNKAVSSLVTVDLAQHQFDALVHFSFNVGVGAFKRSTLLKKLNQGKYNDVPFQIRRWVKQKELAGRREVECDMWEGYYNLKADRAKGFANKPVIEKIKQAASSRGIQGTVLATGGLSSLIGTALEISSNTLTEALKDPVKASESISEGAKAITKSAGEVAESVGFIASLFGVTPDTYPDFLFRSLMTSLGVIAIGVAWFGYSRINDMWTGKNP